MSNPLRRLDFWLISLMVASLMAFGAQRWGWGQINRPGSSTPTTTETPLFSVNTGVITPGIVTINAGDPAKFDVSAGVGWIKDWTDPQNPTLTEINFGPFTAVTITALATATFTSLTIGADGLINQYGGLILTQQQHRSEIRIQGILHQNNTSITGIGTDVTSAYQQISAALDYIRFKGPANKFNGYVANGTNLQIKKLAGETALPFINFLTDPQNPTVQTDAELAPVVAAFYSHPDGSGGYTTVPAVTVIDPNNYVPSGTGTLTAVTVNRWTIQRLTFFPQTSSALTAIEYGQFQYTSLANAQTAFDAEDHDSNPAFSSGSSTTVLFVEQGATNLSLSAEAVFQNR